MLNIKLEITSHHPKKLARDIMLSSGNKFFEEWSEDRELGQGYYTAFVEELDEEIQIDVDSYVEESKVELMWSEMFHTNVEASRVTKAQLVLTRIKKVLVDRGLVTEQACNIYFNVSDNIED